MITVPEVSLIPSLNLTVILPTPIPVNAFTIVPSILPNPEYDSSIVRTGSKVILVFVGTEIFS